MKMFLFARAVAIALALVAPLSLSISAAQDGENNPSEFSLTGFTDAARGLSFQRPKSWTQDSAFKDGVRFVGGDEWLELRVMNSAQAAAAYANGLALPSGETKLGVKPFKQGKLEAQVISSKATGKSSVTGKPVDLLIDRWVFSLAPGKLAVLTVSGPSRVFDWEGNRDMALSVRLK
jgi:hypothetical protein